MRLLITRPLPDAVINAPAFAAMKPHAIFVNIARRDIVHQDALVDALRTGQIAGAGLDVYEYELQVAPAPEVRVSMGLMAFDNLIAFADGRPLLNPV